MAKKSLTGDFATIVVIPHHTSKLIAADLFDLAHNDLSVSPIDQFVENTLRLNKLWALSPVSAAGSVAGASTSISSELGILLLLGYVSAVESFMRALIRRLILCDPIAQKQCEFLQVSYYAATNHHDELLPEALLEETVFSSAEGITKALQKFLRVEIKDSAILKLLEEYESICQLRHCCVHRFGKLGVKNAAALKLIDTNNFLEKPVKIDINAITSIAALALVLVKALNNDVFKAVLIRTVSQKKPAWTWLIKKDKSRFDIYYRIFASIKDAQKSPAMEDLYQLFRTTYRPKRKVVPKASTVATSV